MNSSLNIGNNHDDATALSSKVVTIAGKDGNLLVNEQDEASDRNGAAQQMTCGRLGADSAMTLTGAGMVVMILGLHSVREWSPPSKR